MELTLLNRYEDFMDKIQSLDLVLTEEQEKRFMELCETKKNENESDTEIRKEAMEIIMNMSYEEFVESLQFNSLPPFVRACKYDTDYVYMFRDTNHLQGLQRAYVHRGQLSQTERDTFIANHVLSFEEACDYDLREKNMKIILGMGQEEFTEALNTDTLPRFVRAKTRDPDYIFLYSEFSGSGGYDYAYWNRMKLRTMEYDQFKDICGI
jgi:hypothetical protein